MLEVRRGVAEITGADADHLVRVLRVEAGQIFELSDNQRAYLAQVESARKNSVIFRINEELPAKPQSMPLLLYPALIKFDRFEWLVEKATELGVSLIQPFAATRTEQGLVEASRKRVERWRRIGLEASQQSRRDHLPRIESALRSLDHLKPTTDLVMVLDEDPAAPPILQALRSDISATKEIGIVLGPEGGWTEEERREIARRGWTACSLGPVILRAETAAISALAIVQAAVAIAIRPAESLPHALAERPPAPV